MTATGTRRETGNRYAHEVGTGYQHTMRVSGPIEPMDAPRRSVFALLWRCFWKEG